MPGVARVLGAQQVEQLLPAGLVLRRDAVLDVGPVEARHEMPGVGPRLSRVAISAWVASVAVAVSAMRGTSGQRSCSTDSCR